jgi:hypothetical protein
MTWSILTHCSWRKDDILTDNSFHYAAMSKWHNTNIATSQKPACHRLKFRTSSSETSATFVISTRVDILTSLKEILSHDKNWCMYNRTQGQSIFRLSVEWLMRLMEVLYSSETSVLTRSTRCCFPDDGIFHSYRGENLESYIALTGWTL